MSYGINIYNAANNIIINQDFTNYHVVSSGTLANDAAWPTIAANDILFIRANTAGAIVKCNIPVANISVSAGLVEYVVVRRTPSPSASTFGLRVYQSDGVSIAFDSGAAAAKIVSSYTKVGRSDGFFAYWNVTLNQPIAVPTGRKRYITAEPFRGLTAVWPGVFPFPPAVIFDQITWTSDTQQYIDQFTTGGGGSGSPLDFQSTKIFLTVDI
jgi:hypothetical protein